MVLFLIIFNNQLIEFILQWETTRTLLKYSDFWNERVHDWLGDMVTFVGVMLAFSLPFTAQVTQWVVSTYGVTNFPEIVREELNIKTLLPKMFLFVGLVIFWRLFIYDISPFTSSLYILLNVIIAGCFLWVIWRLYKIIYYILQCTFNFQKFVIIPALGYLKNITNSISTPYYEIQDSSIIPDIDLKYRQYMVLLRDDEIANFKKGNAVSLNNLGFEEYIWRYISACLSSQDSRKISQAWDLQRELSSSIKIMCLAFSERYYARYARLASGLAYYTVRNQYFFLDKYQKDLKPVEKFNTKYADILFSADILFLAEEIEAKSHYDYYPVLSCQYLLNHSSLGYLGTLPRYIGRSFSWGQVFEDIESWEKGIIRLTQQLITIASKSQKKNALVDIYNNLKNDLQSSDTREINLYDLEKGFVTKESVDYASKYHHVSPEQVMECAEFLFSEECQKYFDISGEKRSELLHNLLRVRYKAKVDKLILFWLGHLSFDTSIIISILEDASPMDPSKVVDIGGHLIPTNIGAVLQQCLEVYETEFRYLNPFDNNLERYQIVLSTMILYFLAKSLRSEESHGIRDLSNKLVNEVYNIKDLSIRNVKTLREMAQLWLKTPKGIDHHQSIQDLCINYGIDFEKLLKLYRDVLNGLIDRSDEEIKKRILQAPLDEKAIEVFLDRLNQKIDGSLRSHQGEKSVINSDKGKERFEFMTIEREWFIEAETGSHYIRKNLDQSFLRPFRRYLEANQFKIMIVFNSEEPEISFGYEDRIEEGKLIFHCEYNFNYAEEA